MMQSVTLKSKMQSITLNLHTQPHIQVHRRFGLKATQDKLPQAMPLPKWLCETTSMLVRACIYHLLSACLCAPLAAAAAGLLA
jgi:hypothetical protein